MLLYVSRVLVYLARGRTGPVHNNHISEKWYDTRLLWCVTSVRLPLSVRCFFYSRSYLQTQQTQHNIFETRVNICETQQKFRETQQIFAQHSMIFVKHNIISVKHNTKLSKHKTKLLQLADRSGKPRYESMKTRRISKRRKFIQLTGDLPNYDVGKS